MEGKKETMQERKRGEEIGRKRGVFLLVPSSQTETLRGLGGSQPRWALTARQTQTAM